MESTQIINKRPYAVIKEDETRDVPKKKKVKQTEANSLAELKVDNEINTAKPKLKKAAEKFCLKENVDVTAPEVQKCKTALQEAEKERDEIKAKFENDLKILMKEKEMIKQQLFKEGKENQLLNIRLEQIEDECEKKIKMKIIETEMEGNRKLYDQSIAALKEKIQYENALEVSATLGDANNRGLALISKLSVANGENDIIKYNATELNKSLNISWETGMKSIMDAIHKRERWVGTRIDPVCILVGGNNMLNGRGDLEKEFTRYGHTNCREYKLVNNNMDDVFEKVKRCFDGRVACIINREGETKVLSEMKMTSLSDERKQEIECLSTRMKNGNL